jgi:hypothetical protein
MWGNQHKTWRNYSHSIIASDEFSARFLTDYLRFSALQKRYAKHIEVIDLQRYKVISDAKKVKMALKEKANTPFVFVVGKN